MTESTEAGAGQHEKKSTFGLIRSWRGYLFEFVLLFLAVFLGFLAESFRERMGEQQLAEEMAQNFYDELITDSAAFQSERHWRYVKCDAILELKAYLRDSSLERVSKRYVRNFYQGTISRASFTPTEIILDQLKNSGSLRQFRNKELQLLIGNLSGVITLMHVVHTYETEFEQTHIIPFMIKHNDDGFYDRISRNGELTLGGFFRALESDTIKFDFKVSNVDTFDRAEVINMIGMYRSHVKGSTDVVYRRYEEVNRKLLAMLRKEYSID